MPENKVSKETLNLNAVCDIRATDSDGNAALPTFEMTGYGGGKMQVAGFGDVVVDLAGLDISENTPILYGHQSFSIDSLMGQTKSIDNTGEELVAKGNITGDSEIARQVLTHARNGYTFQASVGLNVQNLHKIGEDDTETVNGRDVQGPLTLVAKSNLREISILPMGADSTTETKISAEHDDNQNEGGNMSSEDKVKTPSAEDVREQHMKAVAEENRILKISKIADEHPEIKAKAIEEGWTAEQAESGVLKAQVAELKANQEADKEAEKRPLSGDFTIGKDTKPELSESVIEAAAAQTTGFSDLEGAYKEDDLNKASDIELNSITDMVGQAMAMDGKKLEYSRHDTENFLKAAFSTTAISNILSNLSNKYILEGFGGVESAWREIANTRSLVDFKPATGSRLVMSDLLKEMGPGGEIQHGSLSDEARTVQADTKGLMINITRKEIVNDDLGALTDVPNRFGFAAARTLNSDFWTAFKAFVEGSDFTDNIGNQESGTTPLSIANLKTIVQDFLNLKDSSGNYIGVDPATLLVSPKNYAAANEIYQSTNVVNGSSSENPDANIFTGLYNPVVSRYLDATPWYLVADPQAIPAMTVGFLNGRETPVIESADADFNQLGMQMRCYFDYGVGNGDSKALVRAYNS